MFLSDDHMIVAITGGAGFLGHHLAVYMKKMDYKILVIDNLSRANPENLELLERQNISIIKEDILSENLPKILERTGLKKSSTQQH